LAQRSFTVGTVAITDVRDAQARADVVATQVIAGRHELALRHQIVMELVGRPVPALLALGLVEDPLPALDRAGLQQWLTEGLFSSPALRQAQWGLEAARHEVRKASVAHAPTVDLSFSRTELSESASVTTTGYRRYTQDQVGLTINVPLFAGGATQSRVREAMALQDKAQAELDSARRTLTLNLRQHFSSTLASSSQAQGLAVAVKSQELAMRANRRGYEVGMKLGAEVLDAQTKLFEARRDHSRARYDAWLSYIKLKCAAGVVAETDLARIDGLLQPLNPPLVLSDEILKPEAAPALPQVPAAQAEAEHLPAEVP
jgi:outer membrane protein